MHVRLHHNARTTPAIRREIQASTLPTATLARHYNVSEETVRKWRNRADVQDTSHCPQRLQTTLTTAQEAVVVELRKTALLPLDDLLPSCGSSSTPPPRAPASTASCAAMASRAWPICARRRSSPKRPPSVSRTMHGASCTWM